MTEFPVRFCYGRFCITRKPKTCLVTQRIGDRVYFGISRCRSDDVFRKKDARGLALQRLDDAIGENGLDGVQFAIFTDMLSGVASLHCVHLVYDYFRGVDPEIVRSYPFADDLSDWR